MRYKLSQPVGHLTLELLRLLQFPVMPPNDFQNVGLPLLENTNGRSMPPRTKIEKVPFELWQSFPFRTLLFSFYHFQSANVNKTLLTL
jgi:hypothetical protein